MKYNQVFFDYVDEGAIRSAEVIVKHLFPLLKPDSVLDVGCGRASWLRAWKNAGCRQVQGIDGDYIDRAQLHIAQDEFKPVNLCQTFDLGQRFDLVQCLEVAEHIAAGPATGLIDSLVRHGDIILFSAAVPGQGGTQHINERPLEHWRDMFVDRGYRAFDALRPLIHTNARIEPWYRYNSILYANTSGEARLAPGLLHGATGKHDTFRDYAPLPWRIRRAVFRYLPVRAVNQVAVLNARLHRLHPSSRPA